MSFCIFFFYGKFIKTILLVLFKNYYNINLKICTQDSIKNSFSSTYNDDHIFFLASLKGFLQNFFRKSSKQVCISSYIVIRVLIKSSGFENSSNIHVRILRRLLPKVQQKKSKHSYTIYPINHTHFSELISPNIPANSFPILRVFFLVLNYFHKDSSRNYFKFLLED